MKFCKFDSRCSWKLIRGKKIDSFAIDVSGNVLTASFTDVTYAKEICAELDRIGGEARCSGITFENGQYTLRSGGTMSSTSFNIHSEEKVCPIDDYTFRHITNQDCKTECKEAGSCPHLCGEGIG